MTVARVKDGRRRVRLSWLRRPVVSADGNMTLFEHLHELRYRLVISCIAIVVGMGICLAFNHYLFQALVAPYERAVALAREHRPDINANLILNGVTSPFVVAFKISLLAGLVLSAPVWLYQIWAFIVPGLLAREKRWTMIVVGAATPLFVAGVGLAYYVLPTGLSALIRFTPRGIGITNLQSLGDFLSFMTRVMLVFGIAFEIPLFILLLNLAGVLPAKMISKYRSYLIFAMFLFAAVATPSPDAITMLLLALPMTVLVIAAEVLAHVFDRRKRKRHRDDEIVFQDSLSEDQAYAALSADDEREAVSPEVRHGAAPAGANKPRTLGQAFGLPDRRE